MHIALGPKVWESRPGTARVLLPFSLSEMCGHLPKKTRYKFAFVVLQLVYHPHKTAVVNLLISPGRKQRPRQ